MGANATPLAKLIIDFEGLVWIFPPNAAIWTEGVTVLAEGTRATAKTAPGFLNCSFPGKAQVYLIK